MTFTFKIEKGIPTPQRAGNRIYPFSDMEVGDSFECDGEKGVRNAASAWSRVNGKKLAVRKCADGTFRCWRAE